MIKYKFITLIGFALLVLLMNACGAEPTSLQGEAVSSTALPTAELAQPTTKLDQDSNNITRVVKPTQEETPTITTEDKSEEEWEKLPVLTSITIEAGTTLDVPDFFSSDEVGELAILTELTEDELRTAGAVYEVVVVYKEKEIPVQVTIIDTTAPVITGIDDFSVIAGEAISYKKDLELTDNANGEVALDINRESVDASVPGEYLVTYLATDASGNQTSVQITITVKDAAFAEKEQEVERLAEELFVDVLSDDMTKWDITYALWNWCRTKIAYSYSKGDRSSIVAGAYEGLHDRTGDCYAYYATFTYLLQKCDIETIEITRVGGTSNHWWNLVNLGDGWYHCDSSPRRKGDSYRCFMQTDAQVQAYTDSYPEHPNYYVFDESLYPERGTTIVYGD